MLNPLPVSKHKTNTIWRLTWKNNCHVLPRGISIPMALQPYIRDMMRHPLMGGKWIMPRHKTSNANKHPASSSALWVLRKCFCIKSLPGKNWKNNLIIKFSSQGDSDCSSSRKNVLNIMFFTLTNVVAHPFSRPPNSYFTVAVNDQVSWLFHH